MSDDLDRIARESVSEAILKAEKDPDRNRDMYIQCAMEKYPDVEDYLTDQQVLARARVNNERAEQHEARADGHMKALEMIDALGPMPEDAEIIGIARLLYSEKSSTAQITETRDVVVEKTSIGKREINSLFKTAKAEAKEAEKEAAGDTMIYVTSNFSDLYGHAVERIKIFNQDDPAVFAVDGEPTRVVRDQLGEAIIEPFSKDEYFHFVDENTDFYVEKEKYSVEVCPPPRVMQKLHGSVTEYLPTIEHLSMHPVVTRDLRILSKPGYDEATKTLIVMHDDLCDIDVPDIPTDDEVREAVSLIVENALADFPLDGMTREEILADPAVCFSLKTAIAMMVQPMVRPAFSGPAPAYLLTKPTQGTGATLLASTAIIIATGAEVNARSYPTNNEELQKEILGDLAEKREIIFYDNVRAKIGGGALESLLTSTGKTGRRLGSNKKIGGEMKAMMILSCNNATTTPDMNRRTAKIVLDARSEKPTDRAPDTFRHADLLAWVRKNRREIVRAFLILCRNWIAKGARRQTDQLLASYLDWNGIIGGILITAGLGPLVADHEVGREYVDAVDEEDEEIKTLVEIMFEKHGCQFVPTYDPTPHGNSDEGKTITDIALNAGLNTICQDIGNANASHAVRGRLKNRTFELSNGTVVRVRDDRVQGKRGFRLEIVSRSS